MDYVERQAEVAARLGEARLVPVLVLETVDDGLRMADVLVRAGLPVAEVTFRTAAAADVVAAVARSFPGMYVGAGTILTVDDLRRAFDAGARFAVAPGFNPRVVEAAAKDALAFSPGVCTPSEIEGAYALGARLVKFFPAEAAGGLPMLKAMAAPYRHLGLRYMPTGGITAANAPAYWATPDVAAVGGTWLGKAEEIRAGRWDAIEQGVRDAVAILKGGATTGEGRRTEAGDGLVIREGGEGDYEAALAVQRRAYRQKEAPLYGPDIPPLSETPAALAAEVAAGARLVVAELDGAVVASLREKTLPDGTVYFGRLSVDPSMQGRGIGQRMARAVEARHPGAPAFALDCGAESVENRHIYEKIGYRETGERRQIPGGPLVLAMRKPGAARAGE